jgi:ubiquinone/menaquinone biosynthesis C-methylase UbiE
MDILHTRQCRPGGFTITDRALNFCKFSMNSRLVDVGCGLGATVQYVKEHYGLYIIGIDKNREVLSEAEGCSSCKIVNDVTEPYLTYMSKDNTSEVISSLGLIEGDAEKLPFKDNEMEGLLFECSYSKMNNEDRVLKEAARVLKQEGNLIIADFYALGKPCKLSGLLGRMDTKEMLFKQLEKNHFSIELFEDYSKLMKEFFGQMIFEYGSDALNSDLNVDKTVLKEIKCGYCLIIAKKIK